ncbi:hypothetical protein NEMIN01_1022 [Nematocida minor]|uniref:uncharacterized protein n=1 Tax=Nematocida minor TaxID=1912983 RepID=UPI002220DFB1|nr:uncharacterized protein NEMIN01_1022 [Nematocida minor]KAI5190398.1 hypothetical protein NEMIN01_1022 [Nematocida minor]
MVILRISYILEVLAVAGALRMAANCSVDTEETGSILDTTISDLNSIDFTENPYEAVSRMNTLRRDFSKSRASIILNEIAATVDEDQKTMSATFLKNIKFLNILSEHELENTLPTRLLHIHKKFTGHIQLFNSGLLDIVKLIECSIPLPEYKVPRSLTGIDEYFEKLKAFYKIEDKVKEAKRFKKYIKKLQRGGKTVIRAIFNEKGVLTFDGIPKEVSEIIKKELKNTYFISNINKKLQMKYLKNLIKIKIMLEKEELLQNKKASKMIKEKLSLQGITEEDISYKFSDRVENSQDKFVERIEQLFKLNKTESMEYAMTEKVKKKIKINLNKLKRNRSENEITMSNLIITSIFNLITYYLILEVEQVPDLKKLIKDIQSYFDGIKSARVIFEILVRIEKDYDRREKTDQILNVFVCTEQKSLYPRMPAKVKNMNKLLGDILISELEEMEGRAEADEDTSDDEHVVNALSYILNTKYLKLPIKSYLKYAKILSEILAVHYNTETVMEIDEDDKNIFLHDVSMHDLIFYRALTLMSFEYILSSAEFDGLTIYAIHVMDHATEQHRSFRQFLLN